MNSILISDMQSFFVTVCLFVCLFYLCYSTHKLGLDHDVVIIGFVERCILSCPHQVVRGLLHRVAGDLSEEEDEDGRRG